MSSLQNNSKKNAEDKAREELHNALKKSIYDMKTGNTISHEEAVRIIKEKVKASYEL